MPFSIIINSAPKADVPVSHVQGPVLQAMFLHLMEQVDPEVSARLHDEPGYRPLPFRRWAWRMKSAVFRVSGCQSMNAWSEGPPVTCGSRSWKMTCFRCSAAIF